MKKFLRVLVVLVLCQTKVMNAQTSNTTVKSDTTYWIFTSWTYDREKGMRCAVANQIFQVDKSEYPDPSDKLLMSVMEKKTRYVTWISAIVPFESWTGGIGDTTQWNNQESKFVCSYVIVMGSKDDPLSVPLSWTLQRLVSIRTSNLTPDKFIPAIEEKIKKELVAEKLVADEEDVFIVLMGLFPIECK